MAHAQERRDVEVAAGLLDDAIAGIDKQDDDLGRGHTRDGVAGVLHVARGVREDEGALVRSEVTVGDIDGDALLTLGAQAVDEEGKIHAVEAAVRRGAFHGLDLVGEYGLRVVEQAAHEGGLAVVYGTGGAQAQGLTLFEGGYLRRCGINSGSHQK